MFYIIALNIFRNSGEESLLSGGHMPKVCIIAGSGFSDFEGVSVKEVRKVSTPYGEPSDSYRICEFKEHKFVFLALSFVFLWK